MIKRTTVFHCQGVCAFVFERQCGKLTIFLPAETHASEAVKGLEGEEDVHMRTQIHIYRLVHKHTKYRVLTISNHASSHHSMIDSFPTQVFYCLDNIRLILVHTTGSSHLFTHIHVSRRALFFCSQTVPLETKSSVKISSSHVLASSCLINTLKVSWTLDHSLPSYDKTML